MTHIIVLLFLLNIITPLLSLGINSIPVCTVYTPNSILEHKEHYKPLFIGDRLRYATCTGAAWFHQDYLAVLNLYGKKINTYKFYQETKRFEALQEITNEHGALLAQPENLVISHDGSLLAICSGSPGAGIKLYSINVQTHLINQAPIFEIKTKYLVHNVRFTPDDKYLATTGWDNNAAVCIYKILKNTNTSLKRIFQQPNINPNLATKGINFTQDGKFAVVICSPKATSEQKITSKGLITIYSFNADEGSIGKLICYSDSGPPGFCYEDVTFINNDTSLICSDQMNNMTVIYPFDPATGQINNNYTSIADETAQLNFPHGIALSPNGKYLVVTNYGDDKFNVYQLG